MISNQELFPQNILPTLIFSEEHHDPIVKRVLQYLLPDLKQLGYRSFYDEVSEDYTIPDLIEILNKKITTYNSLVEISKKTDNNPKPSYDDLLCKYYLEENSVVVNFLQHYPTNLSYLSFLLSLKENSIEFKGIDFKSSCSDEEIKFAKSAEGIIVRDKKMSKHYLEAESPVIGRIGLAHVDGLIRNINESPSKQEFKFFYIFSSGNIESYQQSLGRKIHEDVIIIDATNLNDEEIKKLIFKNIGIEIEAQKDNKPCNIITSSKATASFFNKKTQSNMEDVSIERFSDYGDIVNYFDDKEYSPDIVSFVLKMIFSSSKMDKILPDLMYLNNLLCSVLMDDHPSINEAEHDELKSLCIKLLLTRDDYFAHFDKNDYGFSRLKNIFPNEIDSIMEMAQKDNKSCNIM